MVGANPLGGPSSPGRYCHSDTALYISLAILYAKHTGRCENDVNVHAEASPHIFLNATSSTKTEQTVSLGLVALDDVFRVHTEAHNFAVEQLHPRVPSNCEVGFGLGRIVALHHRSSTLPECTAGPPRLRDRC